MKSSHICAPAFYSVHFFNKYDIMHYESKTHIIHRKMDPKENMTLDTCKTTAVPNIMVIKLV